MASPELIAATESDQTGVSTSVPENIQVALRLRPLSSEVGQTFGVAGTLSWAERRLDLPDGISCNFSEVFGEEEPIEQVFGSAFQPLVDGALDGYNAALFTWGAPQTGKTTAVFGDVPADASSEESGYGLAHLAIQRLFHRLDQIRSDCSAMRSSITATAIELGGLEVVDLLSRCDDREQAFRRCSPVEGFTALEATSADEMLHILSHARQQHRNRRRSLPEGLNRRHCVFKMHCKLDKEVPHQHQCLTADLSVIDLAGAVEGAEQTRASSASALVDLSRVIESLATRRTDAIVSYDASPLSQLMQGALGGNCRTVMLLTAAGSAEALKAEVFVPPTSLRVAANASEVTNYPRQNCKCRGLASSDLEPCYDSTDAKVVAHKAGVRAAVPPTTAVVSLVADDSVFDMSMDSEGFAAPLPSDSSLPHAHGLALPLASPTSPLTALSPIPNQAGSPRVTNGSPTSKPPPIPRLAAPTMLKEVLQQKLAELSKVSSGASASHVTKQLPVRLVSAEAVSDATLTPTPSRKSTEVFSVPFAESSTPRSNGHSQNETRPDLTPHAQQQIAERLAKMRQQLEKRTMMLTKAQLRLDEANLCASQWESVAERLNQKVMEQATVISALERLLGLFLLQQGPEILEDIAKLEPDILLALRNYASAPTSDIASTNSGSIVEQDNIDRFENSTAEHPEEESLTPRPSPWPPADEPEVHGGGMTRSPQSPLFGTMSSKTEEAAQHVRASSNVGLQDCEHQFEPTMPTDPPLPANVSTTPVQMVVLPAPIHHVVAATPRSPQSSRSRLTPQSSPAKSPAHQLQGNTVVVQPAQAARGTSAGHHLLADIAGGSATMEAFDRSLREKDDHSSQAHLQSPLSLVSTLPHSSSDGSQFFSAVWYGGAPRSNGSPHDRSSGSPDLDSSIEKGSMLQMSSPARLQRHRGASSLSQTDALLRSRLADHHSQKATALGSLTPASSSVCRVISTPKLESSRTSPRMDVARSCVGSSATLDGTASAKMYGVDLPRGAIRVYKPLENLVVGVGNATAEASGTTTPPQRTTPLPSVVPSPSPAPALQNNVLRTDLSCKSLHRMNFGPAREVGSGIQSRGRVLEATRAQRGISSARSPDVATNFGLARSLTPVCRESGRSPGAPPVYSVHGEVFTASSTRSNSPVSRHSKSVTRRVLQSTPTGSSVATGRLTPPPRRRVTPPGTILAPPVRICAGMTSPSLPPNHSISFVGHVPGARQQAASVLSKPDPA